MESRTPSGIRTVMSRCVCISVVSGSGRSSSFSRTGADSRPVHVKASSSSMAPNLPGGERTYRPDGDAQRQ
ncbi:Uncharacterised protein [Mycobacteroides abscessus subsp. abscessus]|nr:Uncharacterised protein [Mycobacteroides abscessus subsp. abscessus]SKU60188.1 Uncharacterised protein [Mycobacteroides abscessus subsp. abscessus]